MELVDRTEEMKALLTKRRAYMYEINFIERMVLTRNWELLEVLQTKYIEDYGFECTQDLIILGCLLAKVHHKEIFEEITNEVGV